MPNSYIWNGTDNYEVRWANNPEDAKHYDTQRLRKEFAIEKVFAPGEVNWVYSMYDRFLIGGAEPVNTPIKLEAIAPLKVDHILHQRDLVLLTLVVMVSLLLIRRNMN